MARMINVTISVPEGSTSYGTPNLICVPTQWYNFIVFFGVNYIAHAFTLVTSPGASNREQQRISFYALVCPGSGIIRCLRWIFAFATRESDPLAKAARAGALCMVLKLENVGGMKQEPWFRNVFDCGTVRLVPINRNVYGTFELPQNRANGVHLKYYLAEVPPKTPLEKLKRYRNAATFPPLQEKKTLWGAMSEWWFGPAHSEEAYYTRLNATNRIHGEEPEVFQPDTLTLPKNQNVVQLLFSLAQSSYAAYTLYRARGNQIDMYGFSAFGLTVAPYALMSVINIIASICTPAYPCMFLIETRDLDEARRDGGRFAGAVARVKDEPRRIGPDTIRVTPTDFLRHSRLYKLMIFLLIIAPIGIVGGMSRFQFVTAGNSLEQRIWISLWLFVGTVSSLWLNVLDKFLHLETNQHSLHGGWDFGNWLVFAFWLAAIMPLWIPAVGGMVQVGVMLSRYGYCTKFDFSPL